MNICDKEKQRIILTKGRLYKVIDEGYIYLAIGEYNAIRLVDGEAYYNVSGIHLYEDVTDQYCLTKVK